jgi:hypothetical protein
VATSIKIVTQNMTIRKIFGGVLKIGNCLNAGQKNKERADGFHLDGLAKASNIKGSDGRSVLQMVV